MNKPNVKAIEDLLKFKSVDERVNYVADYLDRLGEYLKSICGNKELVEAFCEEFVKEGNGEYLLTMLLLYDKDEKILKVIAKYPDLGEFLKAILINEVIKDFAPVLKLLIGQNKG
ncbi:hypothetical protein [Methanocaldococcus sp.]